MFLIGQNNRTKCVLWGESGGGYYKLGNNGSPSLDAVITAVLLEIAKFLIKRRANGTNGFYQTETYFGQSLV